MRLRSQTASRESRIKTRTRSQTGSRDSKGKIRTRSHSKTRKTPINHEYIMSYKKDIPISDCKNAKESLQYNSFLSIVRPEDLKKNKNLREMFVITKIGCFFIYYDKKEYNIRPFGKVLYSRHRLSFSSDGRKIYVHYVGTFFLSYHTKMYKINKPLFILGELVYREAVCSESPRKSRNETEEEKIKRLEIEKVDGKHDNLLSVVLSPKSISNQNKAKLPTPHHSKRMIDVRRHSNPSFSCLKSKSSSVLNSTETNPYHSSLSLNPNLPKTNESTYSSNSEEKDSPEIQIKISKECHSEKQSPTCKKKNTCKRRSLPPDRIVSKYRAYKIRNNNLSYPNENFNSRSSEIYQGRPIKELLCNTNWYPYVNNIVVNVHDKKIIEGDIKDNVRIYLKIYLHDVKLYTQLCAPFISEKLILKINKTNLELTGAETSKHYRLYKMPFKYNILFTSIKIGGVKIKTPLLDLSKEGNLKWLLRDKFSKKVHCASFDSFYF